MQVIHVVIMADVFKTMVAFIVNVILDILEINANVSYKSILCYVARNI